MVAGLSRNRSARRCAGLIGAGAVRSLDGDHRADGDPDAPQPLRVLCGVATVMRSPARAGSGVRARPAATRVVATGSGGIPACPRSHRCRGGHRGHPNVYDDALYSMPERPDQDPQAARCGDLSRIDGFEYPPPFLLLPRALGLVVAGVPRPADVVARTQRRRDTPRFTGRSALRSDPRRVPEHCFLTPLVWVGVPDRQHAAERQCARAHHGGVGGRHGALSAAAQRRWSSAIGIRTMTASSIPGSGPVSAREAAVARSRLDRGDGSARCWLTLVDIGTAPFAAFLDHLPGLVGGEAFPAFRNPVAMAINTLRPWACIQAQTLRCPRHGFRSRQNPRLDLHAHRHWRRRSSSARRTRSADEKPLVWLAILILATLRSPFLPQGYGVVPGERAA